REENPFLCKRFSRRCYFRDFRDHLKNEKEFFHPQLVGFLIDRFFGLIVLDTKLYELKVTLEKENYSIFLSRVKF
ncbi:hypothetical protein LEP1GSC116_0494, partial [Leptospira interrogans serovar Icterohaemorrhagiae str. Verdun HP]